MEVTILLLLILKICICHPPPPNHENGKKISYMIFSYLPPCGASRALGEAFGISQIFIKAYCLFMALPVMEF
jgi:hypothetical protein